LAQSRLQRVYEVTRLYQNFFQPVRKVVGKERIGAKVTKRFDTAQTPYQRLLASGVLSAELTATLQAQYARLNPVQLRRQIETALEQLWQAADRPATAPPPATPAQETTAVP